MVGLSGEIGGDVIVSVNGKLVLNNDYLASYLEENEVAGQTVQIGVLRAGTVIYLKVVLGFRPASAYS
jgi:S1-C subfamily serine protease